jgi:hypothetical protein
LSSCNPTHLSPSDTGIADSGSSSIYFAPDAPVANLDRHAPTVGVQVANGFPEKSAASATLASAPSLPQESMLGHVMHSFPHTLIRLGQFTNLGETIVFTKMDVKVVHPDGHCVLKGWREGDGPCLWRFPLKATKPSLPVPASYETYEEPGLRGSAAGFFKLPLANLIERPLTPAVPFPPHRHPSQEFQAIDDAGQACAVTFVYAVAQAMALAAQPPFNPQRLDLPSIGALISFYHASIGFTVKQTAWLNAVKAGNFDSFDGLTFSNVSRYCPDADKTILGHLSQQRQNVRLTKPRPAARILTPFVHPPTEPPSSEVYINVNPISTLYTDDTCRFPVKARSGNQHVMIAYHADGNLILQQAFKNRSDTHCIAAYNVIMTRLAARGLSVKLQILDNEASAAYKQAITVTWQAQFQLVPPDMHRRNQPSEPSERSHFISILAGVDPTFPPYFWGLLLPQAELTLNLLQDLRVGVLPRTV